MWREARRIFTSHAALTFSRTSCCPMAAARLFYNRPRESRVSLFIGPRIPSGAGALLESGVKGIDGAFQHGGRQAVDPLRGSSRALGGGCLHARQAGIDGVDGLVGLVHLDGDDQFEFVIGHRHRAESRSQYDKSHRRG